MNVPVSSRHVGQIADIMYTWEERIAEELDMKKSDVEAIKMKHPFQLKSQTYVCYSLTMA